MTTKRNTLKKIAGFSAVASVLPNSWVKPIVSSVVLPAHAQTSGVSSVVDDSCTPTTSLSVVIDSVTPNPGTLNYGVGDSIEIQVSYTVTNPPADFEGSLSFYTPVDHNLNQGFGGHRTVTDSSGTETLVFEYNSLQAIVEDNGGAHLSRLSVTFNGNDNCTEAGSVASNGARFNMPIDITVNAR